SDQCLARAGPLGFKLAGSPAGSERRWKVQATEPPLLEAESGPEPPAVGDSGSGKILGVGIAIPTAPRPIAWWVQRSRRSAAAGAQDHGQGELDALVQARVVPGPPRQLGVLRRPAGRGLELAAQHVVAAVPAPGPRALRAGRGRLGVGLAVAHLPGQERAERA